MTLTNIPGKNLAETNQKRPSAIEQKNEMQVGYQHQVGPKRLENRPSEAPSCPAERKAAIEHWGTPEARFGARRSHTKTAEEAQVLFQHEKNVSSISVKHVFFFRHSEHQIGFLEDKAHKARVRKHGSNYLLETYLKGLSEAVDPEHEENPLADKNSDSGVVTEGDSEQSHSKKNSAAEVTFSGPHSTPISIFKLVYFFK